MSTAANNLQEYPLDAKGELAYHELHTIPVRWVPNTPFRDTMRYDGYSRTSAAVQFAWLGDDGRRWMMGMAEMDDLLARGRVDSGLVVGAWRVRKRGSFYGLEMVEVDTP